MIAGGRKGVVEQIVAGGWEMVRGFLCVMKKAVSLKFDTGPKEINGDISEYRGAVTCDATT